MLVQCITYFFPHQSHYDWFQRKKFEILKDMGNIEGAQMRRQWITRWQSRYWRWTEWSSYQLNDLDLSSQHPPTNHDTTSYHCRRFTIQASNAKHTAGKQTNISKVKVEPPAMLYTLPGHHNIHIDHCIDHPTPKCRTVYNALYNVQCTLYILGLQYGWHFIRHYCNTSSPIKTNNNGKHC